MSASNLRIILIALAFVTAGTSQANAAACPDFAAAANYTAESSPASVALADLNGDGKLDIATANYGSTTVSVLLNNGNGTFAAAVSYDAGNGRPYFVAAGDVNGDGKRDLVVGHLDSSAVSVLLGTGNGVFGPAVNYNVGLNPIAVALGDMNGDGKLDIAVANQAANSVSILLGIGNGTLAPAVNYGTGGADPYSVTLADLNGDGKLDLAVPNYTFGGVSILLGNGNGTFATAVNYPGGGHAVAVADFNGDGKPDLADTGGGVSIMFGNGDGTFQVGVYAGAGERGAVADFNGDGKPDIAVHTGAAAVIMKGNAFGAFAAVDTCDVSGGDHRSMAVGDLNGDGKPDVAVPDFGSNNVSVLLNTSAAFSSAFTDDPLTSTTPIKAVHFNELRTAVNNVRTREGLSTFSFTDPVELGTTARATQLTQLRDALNDVYDAHSVPRPTYLDPTVTAGVTLIKRTHLAQLRDAESAADWPLLTVGRSGTGGGTVTTAPTGINCGSTCTKSYAPGTAVTLTATAQSNSTFAGWSGACSGTGTCQTTLTADTSATATFNIKRFTLTVTKSGTGSGSVTSAPAGVDCGSYCQEVYDIGTSVTLTPTAAAGSIFSNWTGACAGSGACTVTVNADATVGAVFALYIPATLSVTKTGTGTGTVTSSPSGIDCGGDCQETYQKGTPVTLTANASATSYFANWTGACSGDGNCSVTMNADTGVGALFTALATYDAQPRNYSFGTSGGCVATVFAKKFAVGAPAGTTWTVTKVGTPTTPPHTEELNKTSDTGPGDVTLTVTVPAKSPSFGSSCSNVNDSHQFITLTFKFFSGGTQVQQIDVNVDWYFRYVF